MDCIDWESQYRLGCYKIFLGYYRTPTAENMSSVFSPNTYFWVSLVVIAKYMLLFVLERLFYFSFGDAMVLVQHRRSVCRKQNKYTPSKGKNTLSRKDTYIYMRAGTPFYPTTPTNRAVEDKSPPSRASFGISSSRYFTAILLHSKRPSNSPQRAGRHTRPWP